MKFGSNANPSKPVSPQHLTVSLILKNSIFCGLSIEVDIFQIIPTCSTIYKLSE